MNFSVLAKLVDVHTREIYPARVMVADGKIAEIERLLEEPNRDHDLRFIMPGFVDAHIHVESSMLLPSEFARVAVRHGTVATVSDPHEIANVCGAEGVELMLRNAATTDFKFCFGAPSCVPATTFETAGARLDAAAVDQMMDDPRIGYLSEMMNFPGVLNRTPEVMSKIKSALDRGKPVDGHAPGLMGDQAADYFSTGISTDHECFTLDEALDKLASGCKIAIREGSAARNFDALQSLIDSHTDRVMLCSDDKHPDEFLVGHINQLAARAVAAGRDLMNVLQVACVNPIEHYGLNVGTLRVGDPADFIVVQDLVDFKVIEAYLDGVIVARDGECLMPAAETELLNNFVANPVSADQLRVAAGGNQMRVIEAIEGQLITREVICDCRVEHGQVVADPGNDILKIVVANRYHSPAGQPSDPQVAFITGFELKRGALASSVAHDSHNIVAIGTNDDDLVQAINSVIQHRGGLSVSCDGSTDVLPLPVAGLMSDGSCESVAAQYGQLDRRVKEYGSTLRAPFMTLSFMALLVIPRLKISDRGLFDGDKFEFVPLFV